jgi:hypothetical protein
MKTWQTFLYFLANNGLCAVGRELTTDDMESREEKRRNCRLSKDAESHGEFFLFEMSLCALCVLCG